MPYPSNGLNEHHAGLPSAFVVFTAGGSDPVLHPIPACFSGRTGTLQEHFGFVDFYALEPLGARVYTKDLAVELVDYFGPRMVLAVQAKALATAFDGEHPEVAASLIKAQALQSAVWSEHSPNIRSSVLYLADPFYRAPRRRILPPGVH